MRYIETVWQWAMPSVPVGEATLPSNGSINAAAAIRSCEARLHCCMSVRSRFRQKVHVNRGICSASHCLKIGSGPVDVEMFTDREGRLGVLFAVAVLDLRDTRERMNSCHVSVHAVDAENSRVRWQLGSAVLDNI